VEPGAEHARHHSIHRPDGLRCLHTDIVPEVRSDEPGPMVLYILTVCGQRAE